MSSRHCGSSAYHSARGALQRRQGQCVAPGHTDHNPSMYLYDDHVHCFACGFHGDVVDVWAAQTVSGGRLTRRWTWREFSVRLPEISEETAKKSEEHRGQEQATWRPPRSTTPPWRSTRG